MAANEENLNNPAQKMPQFSEEAGEELSKLLVEFFEKHLYKDLSDEDRSCVEVKIKLKPQDGTRQLKKARTIFGCTCEPGEGPGCGTGFHMQCL